MIDQSITCPHCNKSFSLDEIMTHKIRELVVKEEKSKFEAELKKVQESARVELTHKLQEEYDSKLKNLLENVGAEKERNSKLTEELTNLTKELRASRNREQEAALKMQKQLAEEESKIRADATAKAEELQSLKAREKDKIIADLQKALTDAQKKASQSSQQLQGEVLELEIEEILRKEFPLDEIREVKKGVRGADALQIVVDKLNRQCGIILWESKNAKWSDTWITKLKNDTREASAHLGVLVATEVSPSIKTFGYVNGVWVVKREFLTSLATVLRYNLIALNQEKASRTGQNEKSQILYEYITSLAFRQRIEAMVEAFTQMQIEQERERRRMQTKWAKEEKILRQLIDNTQGMYGDLQAVIGSSLKELEGDLPPVQNQLAYETN